ncbi:MAG: hypothetical protein OEW26_06715 [Nitrospirota bacterium]|nr:hypothetical protein [Nitrospirota bacterium]
MAISFSQLKFLLIGIFPVLGLCFLLLPATAQIDSAPDPFDAFLQGVLNFREPTGIRGTLRYIEPEEQIIWLNWEERSDDRPLFQTGWQAIPGEATLAVRPANAEQFSALQELPNGTRLELIIQANEQGHRRILSFQDRSTSPKVPL